MKTPLSKAFSRVGYVRRKRNYEEGKKFFGEQIILFGEQISRAGEHISRYEERIILFVQGNVLRGETRFCCLTPHRYS